MLNAYSINASPLNTATVLGAAKRLAVNALAGAITTGAVAIQRFLSAQASAGAAGTTSSAFFKQKNLGTQVYAGVFHVTADIDIYAGSIAPGAYTTLSVNTLAGAKATPAVCVVLAQNSVNASAGAKATAAIAIQRALKAQGSAGAIGYETGFFSNAYMGARAIVSPTVTVGFVNIRGLSGLTPTVALAGASATATKPVLATGRWLAATGKATATATVVLRNARALFVSANATASALLVPPILGRSRPMAVSAKATALGSVDLGVNIYAKAPSQRIVIVPYSPRVVFAPAAPRVPIEDVH